MASSIQTLVKILKLEQEKNYQNKAVIGGFGRFAYHWAREAHSQATTDAHHKLIDNIEAELRRYDDLTPEGRSQAVEALIALATGEQTSPAPPTTPPTTAATPIDDVEAGASDDFFDPFGDDIDISDAPEDVTGTRERRGYAWKDVVPLSQRELELLAEPVTVLDGVGKKRAEQFQRLGVETLYDMLMLLPRRHDDYSRMKFIKELRPNDTVSVIGILDRAEIKRMRGDKKRIEAFIKDKTGSLRLNWFNQTWLASQLNRGEPYVVSGTIEQYLGRLVMNNPQIEAMDTESLHAGRIVPIYPLTAGLSEKMLRSKMKEVVDQWAERLPDPLPLKVREEIDMMDYGDAIAQVHFPDTWEDKEDADFRLAFDELFTMHLSLLRERHTWQSGGGTPLSVDDAWVTAFEEGLPFTFTGAQRRVIEQVRADMASERPMNRLVQGDVGSGKTVVAALAMALAVENGAQAALMAPTSILAEQHYTEIQHLLGDGIAVALLTGRVTGQKREEVYAGLADGSIQVVVGTHALIQEGVAFDNLGMAVIDEQHRFGVAQRGALRDKAKTGNPHLLVMTATPIPRTLALTAHADLDLSIIDEMPPGRQPIETRVIQAKERERAYAFIRSQVKKGQQAYIICPLVEDSESIDAASAESEYERLQKGVFPDLRLGLVHGRLNADDKEAAMDAFYAGESDILVSTTVIEVGVNVPNATVMMIENAPRFGLAQLHQLRGRVGRGQEKSYCLLVSDKNFLEHDERLIAMENTTDGFKLAELDLKQRGAGHLLGFSQSGHGGLAFTDLMNPHLIETVQTQARRIFDEDPTLEQHPALAEMVRRAHGDIS